MVVTNLRLAEAINIAAALRYHTCRSNRPSSDDHEVLTDFAGAPFKSGSLNGSPAGGLTVCSIDVRLPDRALPTVPNLWRLHPFVSCVIEEKLSP